jgi:hypothetical protein
MDRASNPLSGWTVDRAGIRTIGRDLQRPECILAERDGTLWSADARGGVMQIRPDGTQELVAQTGHKGVDAGAPPFRISVLPSPVFRWHTGRDESYCPMRAKARGCT